MTYYINLGLLLVLGAAFLKIKPTPNKKLIFCIFAGMFWILISGLRGLSVGNDTANYRDIFLETAEMSWKTLTNNCLEGIREGAEYRDFGYYFLIKAFAAVIPDFQAFLIFVALLFHIPLTVWIYRESRYPLLSFFIYSTLFYSFFAITGIRQTIATAIVVFCAFPFIKKRKLLPFLLLVLLGMTIHRSVIIVLPMYFLYGRKINRPIMAFSLVGAGVVAVFRVPLLAFLNDAFDYSYGEFDTAGPLAFTAIFAVILIGTFIFLPLIRSRRTVITDYWVYCICVGCMLLPLVFVNPSLMRTVQYYSVVLMAFLPEVVRVFGKKTRTVVYAVCIGVLLMSLLKNQPEYVFFWQTV